jgi:hypothetical protein
MLVTQFTDEEEDAADSTAGDKGEPEYAFEGFNIEFSDKIMLTPLNPDRSALAKGQSVTHAFVLEPKVDKVDEMPRAPFERIQRDEDRREARQKIIQIAAGSDIARYPWLDRGIAPLGYIKGMALVYSRVYCKLRGGDAAATEMAKANTGNAGTDALAHYAREFDAAGMSNNAAGTDTLRHLFVLLIGLGMRESSGHYCEGRDTSAANTTAETAEAGLFQTSFNARHGSPLMTDLFRQYSANPSGFLEVFKEGVTCSAADLTNFGAGDGKEFQRLSKASPAFAAEFTAVGLRNIRAHWGPINNKVAEIRPQCDAMLLQVQNAIDQSNLCPLLQD